MSRYLSYTKSAYYGVLCALPLLAVYELVLWSADRRAGMQVRNAADVWLRVLLESLGLGPAQATLATMGLLIALVPLLRRGEARLEGRYLALMLGEALLYSLALGVAINLLLYVALYSWLTNPAALLLGGGLNPLALPGGSLGPLALPGGSAVALPAGLPVTLPPAALLQTDLLPTPALALPGGGDVLTGIALSLGAGLFEEFAFRVVLLTVLLGLFGLAFPRRWAALLAIVCAALAFSLAHYAGELGEPFRLHTLLYRWLAGLLFTLLYYRRGFALAAWSHALYDVWVLVM